LLHARQTLARYENDTTGDTANGLEVHVE
jgi:hypothetical protein